MRRCSAARASDAQVGLCSVGLCSVALSSTCQRCPVWAQCWRVQCAAVQCASEAWWGPAQRPGRMWLLWRGGAVQRSAVQCSAVHTQGWGSPGLPLGVLHIPSARPPAPRPRPQRFDGAPRLVGWRADPVASPVCGQRASERAPRPPGALGSNQGVNLDSQAGPARPGFTGLTASPISNQALQGMAGRWAPFAPAGTGTGAGSGALATPSLHHPRPRESRPGRFPALLLPSWVSRGMSLNLPVPRARSRTQPRLAAASSTISPV